MRLKFLLSVVCTVALSGIFIGVAAPVNAVEPIPPTTGPINILPSVIKSSTPASKPAQWAALIRAAMLSRSQVQAIGAVKSGTATPVQLSQTAGIRANFLPPATAAGGTLIKVVGGASGVMSAGAFGVAIGGGIVQLYAGVTGDTAGIDAVCRYDRQNGGFAGLLTGTSCPDPLAISAEFQANLDQLPQVTYDSMCNPTACYQVYRVVPITYNGSNTGSRVCFTNPTAQGAGIQAMVGGTWRHLTESYFQTPNGYCSQAVSGRIWYADLYMAGTPTGFRVPNLSGGYVTATTQNTYPDPLREMACELSLLDGQVLSGIPITYHETDPNLVPPDCPSVPDGGVVESITIEEGISGSSQHPLYHEETTPAYQSQAQEYPECQTGMCILDLRSVPGNQSCFEGVIDCSGWTTEQQNYQCSYGGKVVSISECMVYGPTFNPQDQAQGTTIGSPWDGTATNAPGLPGTAPATYVMPVHDPTQPRNCFPTGWGIFNPIEWIQKPVQCAAQWAFVPHPDIFVNTGQSLQGAINDSIFSDVENLQLAFAAPFLNAGNTCAGPAFRIAIDLDQGAGMDETYYPLAACDGPMATLAGFVNAATQGIVFLFAGLAIIRYFASIVGFVGAGSLRPDSPSSPAFKAKGTE